MALGKERGGAHEEFLEPLRTGWVDGRHVRPEKVPAWRGSPAAWNEESLHVTSVTLRTASAEEQHKLHRLGDGVAIATLSVLGDDPVEVAAGSEQRTAPAGPFPRTVESA
ncbi:MAG TPA: hypothetical protein VK964_10855 [Nocardioidaceae bacterium]|nr:hypothetical protein [Nocardioidaceae bacterium]